jgi:phosphoribosylanthranilate isomerase
VSGDGTLIKICGLTSQDDVSLCESLGVDLVGFIFHARSPRSVSPDHVRSIRSTKPLRVGVFVDQSPGEILEIMSRARLDLAQLHGDHPLEECLAVSPGRVIKVFWPERYAKRQELEDALQEYAGVCSHLLLDAGTSGGGHGQHLDFSTLSGLACQKPWFLAGGLGPENIEIALNLCRPDGMDLNSGVEKRPGRKDPVRLRTAVAALRRQTRGFC